MLRTRHQRQVAQVVAGGAMLLLIPLTHLGWLFLAGANLWLASVSGLSAALLVVAVRRPLLGWRIAWLAACYDLTLAGEDVLLAAAPSWLPNSFPPLYVSIVQVVAFFVVLYLAAASQPRGVAAWVWALTVGLGIIMWLTWLPAQVAQQWDLIVGTSTPPDRRSAVVVALAVATVSVLAGQLARSRARSRARLAAAEEHGLVLAERARIARELHDVVAHHMSTIAVRAETAPYRLGEVGPAARDELQEISRASRTALSEMRRLLGILRDGTPPPTAPQPGLTDLADLLEGVRGAGAKVTVEMHGAMAGLPPAVDVCAYRIVQEALTNAARHAPGAPVHLTRRRDGTGLALSIRNGPGGSPAPHTAGGHGVRGMRERAAMLGGTLAAGPTADGGFEVSATLPLAGDRP